MYIKKKKENVFFYKDKTQDRTLKTKYFFYIKMKEMKGFLKKKKKHTLKHTALSGPINALNCKFEPAIHSEQ